MTRSESWRALRNNAKIADAAFSHFSSVVATPRDATDEPINDATPVFYFFTPPYRTLDLRAFCVAASPSDAHQLELPSDFSTYANAMDELKGRVSGAKAVLSPNGTLLVVPTLTTRLKSTLIRHPNAATNLRSFWNYAPLASKRALLSALVYSIRLAGKRDERPVLMHTHGVMVPWVHIRVTTGSNPFFMKLPKRIQDLITEAPSEAKVRIHLQKDRGIEGYRLDRPGKERRAAIAKHLETHEALPTYRRLVALRNFRMRNSVGVKFNNCNKIERDMMSMFPQYRTGRRCGT